MAGTTTGYGFPYPTGSDLVRNGDNAIQSLAQSVEDLLDGNFIQIFADNNSTTLTTTSSSYSTRSDCSVTFTNGKSGKFAVILTVVTFNSGANNNFASYEIVGSTTVAAGSDGTVVAGNGTGRSGGSAVRVFTGTPGVSTSVTLAIQTSGGTMSVPTAYLQVVTLG